MSANGSAETPPVDFVLAGWRYRALLISVLLSALGYLLFAVFSGWREVAAAIAPVGAFGLVIVLSMLAGALGFTPGGLGSTEGVTAGLMIWSGATVTDAVPATVLIRATTLWFAVGIGLAAVSISNVRRPVGTADDVTGSGKA